VGSPLEEGLKFLVGWGPSGSRGVTLAGEISGSTAKVRLKSGGRAPLESGGGTGITISKPGVPPFGKAKPPGGGPPGGGTRGGAKILGHAAPGVKGDKGARPEI